ncbi:MAG TPA: response regulator transcription factor, partial [Acidimicrobiales bacterium]|jgi:DNA-binding NarL/FixJ family response regulator
VQPEGRSGCIRVLVADDQPVVREGISLVLGALEGFQAVGCAAGCDELLGAIRDGTPDVVLLDMGREGEEALVATRRIKLRYPGVAVLLFSTDVADGQSQRALACGADGVVLKSAPISEVVEAIAAEARGGAVLGQDLAVSNSSGLSARQREVVQHLAAGMSNREISRLLVISVSTTKRHLEIITRKLGASNRAGVVAEAMRRGLVP